MSAEWPVPLRGIVESVVTTPQPEEGWNVAALGLHGGDEHARGDPVSARTWGETRTKQNFARTQSGYVHFGVGAERFVDAALDEWVRTDPILAEAAGWVEVDVTEIDAGTSDGTDWVDWELSPVEAGIERTELPVMRRATGAIVEMTIAASRLGVGSYEEHVLRDRLAYFADVANRCGGPAERAAVTRIEALSDWTRAEETEV